ncbi:MAG: DNA repair exonuclease [Chloroflexi bacterium]|nr:DNA repair exonuclease [Chloroflexota bacterium]MYE39838.1 DNA repair exonuclease [Chloroflexota bacterium]
MARLRFVHAADLHLDSPFRGIRSEAPEYVADSLRRATFDAYENIVALCLRERVDALLVAGDVYDGADRSLRAQLKFVDGLTRLDAAGLRSFVCHGNHDPLDGWEARLSLPPGCVRFGPEVTGEPVFADEPERATVYGVSYPTREVRENLTPLFTQASLDGGFGIGLLHANVGGNSNHDSYAPCFVTDLAETGLDYWALGHVHTRQVLRQERPTVVYPGNPQGRHPLETGERGVYLVEVDDYGAVSLDFHPVDVVRWETLEVGVAGLEAEQELIDAIDSAAASCAEYAEGRSVVFRLTLAGRGPLHRWLRSAGTVEELRERVNERYAPSTSSGQAWLWCERIQANTASPVDREQVAQREDFAGDLARLGGELRGDPAALGELRDALRVLYANSNAAPYLRNHLPSDEELLELLAAAEDECLASLVHEEDEG